MNVQDSQWHQGPVRWLENGRLHISVSFTWELPALRDELLQGNLFGGERPVVGGPAVRLLPDYLADIAEIGPDSPGVLQRVNPRATRTSLGCPNACGFCAVPRLEGKFRELADWPDLPVICDSNLLESSVSHFDKVIDRLKRHKGVDFTQGLDAEKLTDYHASRLSEVDGIFRFAWDWDRPETEAKIVRAVTRLRKHGIPRKRMRCYVILGYWSTPESCLHRLETLRYGLGIDPSPMRYNPLDSLERDTFEGHGGFWTDDELRRYMRYWSNLANTGGVPFEEFH